MSDGTLVALTTVTTAPRAQLRRGRMRDAVQSAGADGGCDELHLGGVLERRNRIGVERLQREIDVVDVDLTRDVRAPETELTRCTQDVTERERRAQPEDERTIPAVGVKARPVPELNTERSLRKYLRERLAQCDCVPAHDHLRSP